MRMHAIESAWRCFRYKDIDHILKCEHKCTPLRLPKTMVSTVIFPYICCKSITVMEIIKKSEYVGWEVAIGIFLGIASGVEARKWS
jgi:hypothetical protein